MSSIEISRRGVLLGGVAAGLALRQARGGEEVLRIGWIRPTTGRLASSFAPLYVGGLIAVDEINAAGGIMGRRIERVEEDDEASPAKEPAIMRKMQDAGINIICGPTGSSQSLSALAVGKNQQIVQAAYATSAEVGNGTKYPTNFQFCFNTVQGATPIVSYLVNTLGVKKVGILQESTAMGEEAMSASRAVLDRAGLKPVDVQVYPLTATDLNPYVANLRKAGAEGIVMWTSNTPQAAAIFNALSSQQWFPPICAHNGLLATSLLKLVPENALKNVYSIHYRALSFTATEQPGRLQQAFAKKLQAYPEAEDVAATVASTPYYDFLHLLKTVIEQEKSFDPVVIRRALNATSGYQGLLGTYGFTPENHTGLALDALCMVTVLSARDPLAQWCFRERAPGQSPG
jgi:ABC-type branched-subunit amino acid transport system substrate-binding protein